jgi:hypothetical protein
MAADLTPTTWFGAGYTLSSHVAGFNTNDASSNKLLTKLTDALANASTGDVRYIIAAMLEMFNAANAAQILAANGSDRITISKTVSTNQAGAIFFNYSVSVNVSSAFTIPSE